MPDIYNSYTVYNNTTNKIIARGTYQEIKEYANDTNKYTVVSNANGMII